MPNTKGFYSRELVPHFEDHGREFSVTTVEDYARLADELWIEPKPEHVKQCARMGGETVRFDPITNFYGVVDNFNYIKTLFKPIPCAELTTQQRAALRPGACHEYRDNLTYFQRSCRG